MGGSLGDLALPLIQRCVDLALPILQMQRSSLFSSQTAKGELQVDNDQGPSESSIFLAKPPAMLGEGESEILRKLLEIVHHAVLVSGAKEQMPRMAEEGEDAPGGVETRGKSRIVQETQIVDMYIRCFGVRTNLVNEFIQCGITDVVYESLSNFLELLLEIPPHLLEKRGEEILGSLIHVLQVMAKVEIKADD